MCLCGNVDCETLIGGPEDEVYKETKKLLDYFKDKTGFILGASNAVVNETPLNNYLALLRAWKDSI